jgi:hypothetical protein
MCLAWHCSTCTASSTSISMRTCTDAYVVRSDCALGVFVSACCDGMLLYCNTAHSSRSDAAPHYAPVLSHLTSTHAQLLNILFHVVHVHWRDLYGCSKCTLLAVSMCRLYQLHVFSVQSNCACGFARQQGVCGVWSTLLHLRLVHLPCCWQRCSSTVFR